MGIKEISLSEVEAELVKRGEAPLLTLGKLLNELHPTKRARALIVSNDSDHELFKTIVNSSLYRPAAMTLTLFKPKDRADLLGQCTASRHAYDYVFLDSQTCASELIPSEAELKLLRADFYSF